MDRAGNSTNERPPSQASNSSWGLQSCLEVHDMGHFQPCCRGNASLVDFFNLSGSSTGLSSSTAAYGPQRRTLTKLKVLGGASTAFLDQPGQPTEAPGSSTSEQLPRETVRFGTSAVRALASILNMEEDDDVLTFEQRALYDLCSKDMIRTCLQYVRHPTPQGGQQLLMDLRRMQNLVQKHLSVHGDVENSVYNIYIISQCLTTILENPRNLCYANAPWRCWCWTGAFAEDMVQAWGRTHPAVREFLAGSDPQSLPELPDMDHMWPHFGPADQADAADFLQSIWSYSGSTYFAGRFFHCNERGHTEEREQFPLNILFPDGAGDISMDTLINYWADEGRAVPLWIPGWLSSEPSEVRPC